MYCSPFVFIYIRDLFSAALVQSKMFKLIKAILQIYHGENKLMFNVCIVCSNTTWSTFDVCCKRVNRVQNLIMSVFLQVFNTECMHTINKNGNKLKYYLFMLTLLKIYYLWFVGNENYSKNFTQNCLTVFTNKCFLKNEHNTIKNRISYIVVYTGI